jgi:hypothetical protein
VDSKLTIDSLPAYLGFVETEEMAAVRMWAIAALRTDSRDRVLLVLYADLANVQIAQINERLPAEKLPTPGLSRLSADKALLGLAIRLGLILREAGLADQWQEGLRDDLEMAHHLYLDEVAELISETLLEG